MIDEVREAVLKVEALRTGSTFRQTIFHQLDNGCIVSNRKHTVKGYVQYWLPRVQGKIRIPYQHRFVWELLHGEIPEGLELDHKCQNEACCNPKHLQIVDRHTHADLTNSRRYGKEYDKIRPLVLAYYKEHPDLSQRAIGKVFNIHQATIHRWLKQKE